jgi:hypothetical protein
MQGGPPPTNILIQPVTTGERVEERKQPLWPARHALRLLREKHPQTLHSSRAEARQKEKQRRGHRALLELRLVALAKLSQNEVGFAHNPGTMPPLVEAAFPFLSTHSSPYNANPLTFFEL